MSPNALSSTPIVFQATVGVAAPAARFRSEGIGTPAGSGAVFAKLAIVLIVGLAVVWVANRKGWLDRWKTGGRRQAQSPPQRTLALLESLRLGQRTIVHKVRDGDHEFLVVESSTNVILSPVGRSNGGAEHAED